MWFLIVIASLSCLALLILIFSRTILLLTYKEQQAILTLTVLQCGSYFDMSDQRIGLIIGPLRIPLPSRSGKPPLSDQKKPAEESKSAPPRRRRLPFRVYVQILKATLLFSRRMVAAIKIERCRSVARPVFANPALAGVAYGWSQAIYGAAPSLRSAIDFIPAFAGESSYEGEVALSIKNRVVFWNLLRLIWGLPLMTIIRHKRGLRKGNR